jgi:anti-anti-sigma factor
VPASGGCARGRAALHSAVVDDPADGPHGPGVWLVCSQIRVSAPVSDASPGGVGASARVKVGGAVDLESARELEDRLRCVLAESKSRATIIDLEDVEFLGACGVSVLLAAKHCAAEAGRDVRIVNAQGSPARMLRLLGFESWCKQAAVGEVEAADEPA